MPRCTPEERILEPSFRVSLRGISQRQMIMSRRLTTSQDMANGYVPLVRRSCDRRDLLEPTRRSPALPAECGRRPSTCK